MLFLSWYIPAQRAPGPQLAGRPTTENKGHWTLDTICSEPGIMMGRWIDLANGDVTKEMGLAHGESLLIYINVQYLLPEISFREKLFINYLQRIFMFAIYYRVKEFLPKPCSIYI